MILDLRSDTVTRPTPAMRDVMARAEVGDDVFGEDPSVACAREEVAALVGKEAALFVTSGTMSNQLAIALHTRPGDEVIVGEGAHVVFYESGAGAALSGVQFAVAAPAASSTPTRWRSAPKRPLLVPRTSLVCVENTHNRAGGRVFPQRRRRRDRRRGTAHAGLRSISTARASGTPPRRPGSRRTELAAPFDTVQPVSRRGSARRSGALAATATRQRARRLRKMWGGGMRQSGIRAAASHALEHHRERLAEDPRDDARCLADVLAGVPRVSASTRTDRDQHRQRRARGAALRGAVRRRKLLGVRLNAIGPPACGWSPTSTSTPPGLIAPSPPCAPPWQDDEGPRDGRQGCQPARCDRRGAAGEHGLRAGAAAAHERLLQFRDLVLDHLHPRRRHHLAQLGISAVGGAAVGIGWPIGVAFSLLVALCMAQVASAFPTAGGLYHWSSILGGKGWGWATAWFNLGGLVFVTAAVNVGAYTLFVSFIGPHARHRSGAAHRQRTRSIGVALITARRRCSTTSAFASRRC